MTPLVAIHCLVYNHEPYLRDCFEGFVMQQTNFPFVAIVHDDASTDGSAAIIREYEQKYPHIFKPIYETENQYTKRDGSIDQIMNTVTITMGAKYVAMCEGDDYWIDPYKLQKQFDFLEEYQEYGMVCGDAYTYIQKTKQFDRIVGELGDEQFEKMFIGARDLNTPTIFMRVELYGECMRVLNPLRKFDLYFDTAIWYWFALNSKIYFMKEEKPMVVYRILENSASHSVSKSKLLEMNQRYFNLKIAFMSVASNFFDDKFQWMLKEIINYENQMISYAQYIAEVRVRLSRRYSIGKFISKCFRKK